MHTFEFNNKKLSDIGAVIMEKPHYTLSVKELDFTALPGKSGDIVTDKNRFKNLNISYKVSSMPLFCSYTEQEFVYALSEWLLTSYDYKILRDTYNPGYFRKAICTNIAGPTVEATGVVWTTVTFNCDPFLYSDRGLYPITYNISQAATINLQNPEKWASEPIITISGSSPIALSIGDDELSISTSGLDDETIIIDKPNENVYDKNGNSYNNKVKALKLPYLTAGNNKINVLGNITLKIIPNWRRL